MISLVKEAKQCMKSGITKPDFSATPKVSDSYLKLKYSLLKDKLEK